jgi:hypothetical protein
MGLDMYLYARREISDETTRQAIAGLLTDMTRYDDEGCYYLSRWRHDDDKRARTDEVLALAGLTPMLGEESNSGYCALDASWVSVTATYWRKANAVHGWFVTHCQDGVDECQEAEVHPEQLAALKAACEAALAAHAAGDDDAAIAAMPPTPGFFFGTYDLDEYWAADLAHTVREIDRLIRTAIAIGGVTFTYQSSW